MSDLYPIVYRQSWDHKAIVDALSELAAAIGFVKTRTLEDYHEDDAERIVADFIRQHGITSLQACQRLREQQPLLSEEYSRHEYYWTGALGEIILVIADSNIIPFPSPTIRTTGELWFASGFVDFAFPDREIERLDIPTYMQRLPLLYDGCDEGEFG